MINEITSLYDTLTRKRCRLQPLDGKTFRFYCCGPTVYGPAHIGNFRTFVIQDILRRLLEAQGMHCLHVRNITDVDDKTIRDAQASGKSLKEFTIHWTKKFHSDSQALGCLTPHIEPSAIDHIPQQINMIKRLIEKKNAYISEDGSVYFKVSSYPEYGKLSQLETRELELGKSHNQRSDADEYTKESLADFALWKSRKNEDGDIFWASPWGDGRPGWHLECSAMIEEYLGTDFDLHSGGVDLVFPHHENEIAQSRCACGGSFASHWFHITHLMVDGGKMSKSLRNLYTLEDLLKKGYTAMEVRYVLLSGHYRKPLNFTLDSLHSAKEALHKLGKGYALLEKAAGNLTVSNPIIKNSIFNPVMLSLQKDLNTPEALGHLFSAIKIIPKLSKQDALNDFSVLQIILNTLGLTLPKHQEVNTHIPSEIREMAEQRWQAKLNKDWDNSDKLRNQLSAQGWIIKDKKEGYDLLPK